MDCSIPASAHSFASKISDRSRYVNTLPPLHQAVGIPGDEQEQPGDLMIQTPNQPSSFPIRTGPLDKGEHGHDNRISSKGKVQEADGGMKAGPSGDFPQRLVNPIDQALDSDACGSFL